MKRIPNFIKVLILTILASCLLVVSPIVKTDTQAAVRSGIDVSSYQGEIDWNTVAASGVEFVMVRVGNTRYGMDAYFAQNVVGANAAGLRVGVYCYSYALTVEEAVADAQFVLSAMANLPISYPVAIDIEDSTQKSLTVEQQQAIVNAFCSTIYAAGYTPMVYSYKNWFLTYLGQTAWDQWIANYSTEIGYTGTMWQYTSSGSVSGISGSVDMNYDLIDYSALIPANGLTTINGATYYYINYLKQFGMQTIGDLVYFFDGTGAMMTDQTLTDAAGNIIRICEDGHMVVITAEAQAAAAQALILAQQQAELLVQCQEAQAAYEQQAAQALTQYTTLQAMADEAYATLTAAVLNWTTLPTEENLNIQTIAQVQYDQYASAAAVALEQYTTLQTAAEAAAQTLTAQTLIAAEAQATSDAAQLSVVIPQ